MKNKTLSLLSEISNLVEISMSQLFQDNAGLMRVASFLSRVLKDQATCSQVA